MRFDDVLSTRVCDIVAVQKQQVGEDNVIKWEDAEEEEEDYSKVRPILFCKTSSQALPYGERAQSVCTNMRMHH